MNFTFKVKDFVSKEKIYIGDNSIFYLMINEKGERAILKLTKEKHDNIFIYNMLYESEII